MMYRTARYTMGVSHLAYADDIIIFSQAQRSTILNLVECLKHYMGVSGQKVNVGKSCFFLDKKHCDWAEEIKEVSGFQQGSFPFKYLGVPIFRGKKKTSMFMFIRDKISARIHSWSHRLLSFGGRLTLIRSVLGAIPIHIVQILDPTKGAMRLIEQVMARFLWGSCSSLKKTHWISWERICLPTKEGGLGIRRLRDSVEAFSVKLWWRFREQSSLWARYMFQKYCSHSFPMVAYRSNRFSPVWRRMFKVGNICREQTKWVLGEGNISFWYDIWATKVSLANLCSPNVILQPLCVKDFWMENHWNEEELWILAEEVGLPDEIIGKILQTPFDRGEKDRGRWKPTGNGNFTTSSAWDLVRSRAEKRQVYGLIWGRYISPSISFFLWRLLANRIPVDLKLQWRGVSLASKCRCCEKSEVESRLHLFVNGSVARRVWQHFARWFPQAPQFVEEGVNIEIRLRWWQRNLGLRDNSHICVLIPCLIMWFIWTERNENVHREKTFEAENVIKRVNTHLKNLVLAKLVSPDQWRDCCPRLDVMEDPGSKVRRGKVGRVQWRPPDSPWIKLNVDGSFIPATNRAGGGGVVRNHEGEIIIAFSTNFQCDSGLEAEVMALLLGVTLAKQHGNQIWIEMDAEMVVRWLASDLLGSAEICTSLAKVRCELREVRWRVSHIFREGNKAADFLADLGSQAETRNVYTDREVPAGVKALCRLDQLGLPNFRF